MVISYYGLTCIKIQSGDTTLVFDLSKIKAPRFHSDIIIQSKNYDADRPEGSFLIDSPGEYEARGVYIRGIKSYADSQAGKKRGLNFLYVVRLENVNLCFLGNFGEKELRSELKEEIGKADVVFIPVMEEILEAEAAANIVNQIEPALAIPMCADEKKESLLKSFLREMGQKDVKPLEKLSLKKKDIKENGTEIVILEKQGN